MTMQKLAVTGDVIILIKKADFHSQSFIIA